jgi:hypothetical protein
VSVVVALESPKPKAFVKAGGGGVLGVNDHRVHPHPAAQHRLQSVIEQRRTEPLPLRGLVDREPANPCRRHARVPGQFALQLRRKID